LGAGARRGDGVHDQRRSDDDARLFCRALRQGWDVPAARRPEVIARLCAIATGTESAPREATAAARALLQAARLQLEAVKVAEACGYAEALALLEELRDAPLGAAAAGDPPA
jgi:hypothetical protein